MLSTQLQNAVIELLSQFLGSDFSNLERLKEQHEAATQGEGRGEGGEGGGEGREGREKNNICPLLTHLHPVCIEHEQAAIKFSRISKKKDSDKVCFDYCMDCMEPVMTK